MISDLEWLVLYRDGRSEYVYADYGHMTREGVTLFRQKQPLTTLPAHAVAAVIRADCLTALYPKEGALS